jgi:protein-S-isoprenylcysteine O-methyltransferase Ste14
MKSARTIILLVFFASAAVGQVVLAILLYDRNANTTFINIGWIILWISAIFGVLPIFTLKKWGGVPKGKGYVNTTVLVDRGIYAIVRHPQYLAWILIGLALPLISQHWLVAVMGLVLIVTNYMTTFDEEKDTLAKLGDDYRAYMQRVPRLNFLLGIFRLIKRKLFSSS